MIDIDEKNLKHGLLGLVIALVEVIRDALKLQAIRRIEGKSLTEEEVERLGSALADLDKAIEDMKEEQGVTEAVQNVRDGLDKIANDVVNTLVNPKELSQEIRNEKIKVSKAKEKLVMVEK
ncbi:MAG: gas vesicle protein K [Nanoarchaeota archaeon]|nr:gas vesicle protein K [Nanoarchaeota archaeon]